MPKLFKLLMSTGTMTKQEAQRTIEKAGNKEGRDGLVIFYQDHIDKLTEVLINSPVGPATHNGNNRMANLRQKLEDIIDELNSLRFD